MATAASLQVVVGADIDGALSGLRAVQKSVGNVGGFFKSAASTAVGFGVATLGIGAAAAAPQALADAFGLGLAVELENVTAQLTAFTKDAGQADAILADLRKEADATPFAFRELAGAAASLLPAANASGHGLMDLIKQAEVLAALNPAEGLEGAAFSLREALSGDFVSVVERFNLPREAINQLKKEGVPALDIIGRALAGMGADQELVARRAQTFSGRLSTFQDALDSIRIEAGKPILGALSEELVRFTGILAGSQGTLQATAATLGGQVAGGIRQAGESLGIILVTAQNIAGAHGLGLVDAALIATEQRIGEVFGEGAAGFFHTFVDAVKGIPGVLGSVVGFMTTEFPAAVGAITKAASDIQTTFSNLFAQLRRDFGLFVISLASLPGGIGDSFKPAADQIRAEMDANVFKSPRTQWSGIDPISGPGLLRDNFPATGTAAGGNRSTTVNVHMNGTYKMDTPEDVSRLADAIAARLAAEEAAALEAAGTAVLPGAE